MIIREYCNTRSVDVNRYSNLSTYCEYRDKPDRRTQAASWGDLGNVHVDPDRIYLRGGSIGGGGGWRMAARYPDIFAAALVDCGWTWTLRLHLENG